MGRRPRGWRRPGRPTSPSSRRRSRSSWARRAPKRPASEPPSPTPTCPSTRSPPRPTRSCRRWGDRPARARRPGARPARPGRRAVGRHARGLRRTAGHTVKRGQVFPVSKPDPGVARKDLTPVVRLPLELVVFVVGSASLGAEIAAARLLAPYFGASTIVWANTIATVLVALAVGYWIGGKMADRRPDA